MVTSRGVYWLASYPKSGNTWFRILLSHLLSSATNLDHLNNMDTILGSAMVASRGWLNNCIGFDSTLLTEDEVDELRHQAYAWDVTQKPRIIYNKIHDAYTYLSNQTPLIPTTGTLGAIYFIRNPLDVAISLANHVNCTIDESIYMMGNNEFTMPTKARINKLIRQKMLTWSQHVKSWESVREFKVLVLRYEDMLTNPFATFQAACHFINLQFTEAQLTAAITATSFSNLKQFETQHGFAEKPVESRHFFRKGIAGDWQSTLSQKQIDKIVNDHYPVMQQYRYLDSRNNPVS